MDNQTYWANSPPQDLEDAITAKLDESARGIERSAELFELWRKAYEAFHRATGSGVSAAFVGRRGSQGQGLTFSTGQSRSLASAMAAIVNNAPTALSAGASNTEASSQAAATIATTVLEHEWLTNGLESFSNAIVESSCWAGEWFVLARWDYDSGEVVARDPETGDALRTGGLVFESAPPWRVLREPSAESFEASPWVAVMVRENRHDLAKRYPAKADDIHAESPRAELWDASGQGYRGHDDSVLVTYLYHRPTAACSEGLSAVLVGDTLCAAGPAPRACPVLRMSAGELVGTPYGYTPWWETLASQDMVDDGWSGLLTSLRVLGKPMISLETGSDLDVDRLGDEGPIAVYRAPGSAPPVPLQFSQPPAGADKTLTGLVGIQRNAVGLNDFALGQPPGAQLNASAIALLAAAATMQSSGLQQRRVKFLRGLGEAILSLYQENANSPITIAIIGQSQKGQLERALTFTGGELSGADVVEVDVASGLAATPGGRVQLLEILKANGVAVTAEDVTSVLATGKLQQTLSHERATAQLLAFEEKELRSGKPVMALFSDNPVAHLDHHAALLDDPAIRANPMAVEAIAAHMQEHVDVLQTTDPRILALLGVNLGAPPAPGGPQPAPGAPPPPGAPEMPPLPEGTPDSLATPPFEVAQ